MRAKSLMRTTISQLVEVLNPFVIQVCTHLVDWVSAGLETACFGNPFSCPYKIVVILVGTTSVVVQDPKPSDLNRVTCVKRILIAGRLMPPLPKYVAI